jgi:hypothetical protein
MSDTGPSPSAREERRRRVWSLVDGTEPDPELSGLAASLQRVCRAASESLGLRGAAVHMMTRLGDAGVAAASDVLSRELAELAFTSNEGPSLVAFRTHRPVLVPSLDEARDRWPGFAMLALDQGVRGVFSFPLQEGAVSFGVLELYADRPGLLDLDGQATALAFARATTDMFLDGGATTSAGDLATGISASLVGRARVHQAQGMIMVDLDVSLAEALTRMRARAFGHDLTLLALADLVIAGAVTADSWVDGDSRGGGGSP